MGSTQQSANSTGIRSYKSLIAWQKSDELACKIYELTDSFPKSEIYSLTFQLRRAGLSVPTNIVEGFSRLNKNEFRHFLSIAYGSLAEVGYLLDFSYKQEFLSQERYDNLITLKDECSRLLWKLYLSQK